MKFDNLTTEPCLVFQDVNHPVPPDAVVCRSLELAPDYGYVEVGQKWQFRVLLTYSDGSSEDVTAKAVWSSSPVATITENGLATAVEAGHATVTAEYCSLTAFATLEVAGECESEGVDYALILDRSSGALVGVAGHTIEENIRQGALNFVQNLKSSDQAAVITFAGVRNPGPPVSSSGEGTMDFQLSPLTDGLIQAVQDYGVRTPCPYPDETTGPGTRCTRAIGTGLDLAKAEFQSPRHIEGRRRVAILIFTGRNMVSVPDPVQISTELKYLGVIVCVIGIQVPASYTAEARSLATCGWYFPANDGSEIPAILAAMPHQICYSYTGYCYDTPARATCISPPAQATDLCGLRWEMPCIADMPANAGGCTCNDPDDVVGVMGGVVGTLYNVLIRFAGVIELKRYTGGSNDGQFFQTGGSPLNDNVDGGYNRYALQISDPPQTYYLNRQWTPTAAQFGGGDAQGIGKVDYQKTIQIKGGATARLITQSQDGLQFKNYRSLKFTDVPPTDAPYDGQFLQMIVVSVAVA